MLAELAQEGLGDRCQTALGVPHGGGRIAVDGAEIAIALDQGMTQAEGLSHPHQGVVDRLIAVRVIGLHHLADDCGRLDVPAVGRQVQVFPHRIQDPALHGFKSVTHVRQGSRCDHAQRIRQVPCARGLSQCDILDKRVSPRPFSIPLAPWAVAFRHRWALDPLAKS